MLSLWKIIHTNYFAFISDVEPVRQVEAVFATIDDSEIADEEYKVVRMGNGSRINKERQNIMQETQEATLCRDGARKELQSNASRNHGRKQSAVSRS